MSEIEETKALFRVIRSLERAEEEQPILAAPDGTVAVGVVDLRTVIGMMDRMRDLIALTPTDWRERWYGSPPFQGSSIVTKSGDLVAYLGGNEETHETTRKVVSAHNLSLRTQPKARTEGSE